MTDWTAPSPTPRIAMREKPKPDGALSVHAEFEKHFSFTVRAEERVNMRTSWKGKFHFPFSSMNSVTCLMSFMFVGQQFAAMYSERIGLQVGGLVRHPSRKREGIC